MKSISKIPLLILTFIFFSACTPEKEQNNEINILKEIEEYAVVQETSPLIHPKHMSKYYIQEGWLKQQDKYLMILPRARLRFFVLQKEERHIRLKLSKACVLKPDRKFKVSLHVNGRFFESLNIGTQDHYHSVTLSREIVRKGSNYIELIVLDSELIPKNQAGFLFLHDFRLAGYALKGRFSFKSKRDQNRLVQPANSFFQYYYKPVKNSVISFSFELKKLSQIKNDRIVIEAKEENGTETILKTIVLAESDGNQISDRIELAQFNDRLLRLSFSFESENPY